MGVERTQRGHAAMAECVTHLGHARATFAAMHGPKLAAIVVRGP
jgi:hypothetical protein